MMSIYSRLALYFLAIGLQYGSLSALDCEIITWKSPPYVYDDEIILNFHNTTNKILQYFLGTMKYQCFCNATFVLNFKDYAAFMSYVNGEDSGNYNNKTLRLFMPAYKTSVMSKPYLFDHVGLVKSPGMTLVSNGFFKSKLYQLAVYGSRNAVTFLIIMIFFMIDVGIIIWIFEGHLHNKGGDFRSGFILGVWDAVWWAAVTMTTVGYGDKTPKTTPGRIVGIIWLFMSAVLMAAFTALLTSSLGAVTEIASNKILVLNGTLEADYVDEKRGKKVVVSTVEEALEQANSLDVAGALLETNIVAHYQSKLFGKYLNIEYSYDKEQNVTFMYHKLQLKMIKGAIEFINCMEVNLYPAANPQRPSLQTEQRKTLLEVLSGRAYSISIFSYFYGSTGVILIVGLLVELWNKAKKRKLSNSIVATENAEVKKPDLEMNILHQQPEEMKLVLQELKFIKEALRQLDINGKLEIY